MTGCNKFHDEFQNEENHHVQAFCYTTQADRLAATGYPPCPGDAEKPFDADDVGKIAKQENINPADGMVTFWVLCNHSPVTWDEITNKTVPGDTDVLVGITSSDTVADYLDEKVVTSTGSNATLPLETSVVNPGGDESLDFKLDETKIDHDNLLNSGGNQHIDWTQAGAGTIDPSNYADNDTDELAGVDSGDTAGYLEDKISAGTNVILTKTGPVGSRQLEISTTATLSQNLAGVQARRSTLFITNLAWQDVEFDLTDVENLPSILEHDNTDTDRVQIKETALYLISYSYTIDPGASVELYDARVRSNDSLVLPGSFSEISDDFDEFHIGHTFLAELNAGDFITLQLQQNSGVNTNAEFRQVMMTVNQLKGTKGDQGPAGSGTTIHVEDDDALVPNSPFSTINFGAGLTATDGGGGQVNVSAVSTGFGTEYDSLKDDSVSITTSTTFQNKLAFTTSSLPAGDYYIGWSYNWNHDSNGDDFEARVQLNNSIDIHFHKQEPKDSAGDNPPGTGSSQQHHVGGFDVRTLSGVNTFDLDWRTDTGGVESSIWNARLIIWRVS